MRNSRLSNVKFFLYATLIWLVAVAVFQWHTSRARQAWSATVDETCYLTCATNTAHLGRLDPQLVSFGIAPLPILVQWLPSALSQEHSLRYTYWQGTLNDPALVNAARWLTSWLVGSGLLACVFWWVCLRRGLFWGAVAVLLVAGSPHIIAHCSLATTDALATWMWIGCLAVYTWSLRRLSRAATRTGKVGADLEIGNALAGLACGTAISAKYSGVVLLLVWGAVWTVFSLRPLFSRAAAMKLVSGQALAAGNPAQNRRLAPGRSLGF